MASLQQYAPLRTPRNWSREERKLIVQLTDVFDDLYKRFNRIRFEDLGSVLRDRITDTENNVTEVRQTAEGIILVAATDKVYRAATQAALLIQLAAEDPPVAMSVGLLWLDTTTMLIKRCKVVSPLAWEAVQANEVHTSFIDIQDDSIDIKSTGVINIGANAKLVLSSADRLETTAGTSLSSYVSSAANGRSKVYSTTWAARPTTGVQVDDLLICSDTDPVNKLYRWNGTGWEDARDGSATLAEQTDTKFKWIVSGGTSASTMVLTNEFYEVVADNINLSANDSLKLAVASEKVWRAATENALNTALSAAGITKAAGLLWYDTTNNVVKRWTGTAWANTFVNTSQIVIDDDSIDIGTTGTLNMQAGGKITMSSASSIIIGGSPFSVGGTNLLRNSGNFSTIGDWARWSVNGGETQTLEASSTFVGENVIRVSNINETHITYSPIMTHKFVYDKSYTVSFYGYGDYPVTGWVGDRDGTNTLIDLGTFDRVAYRDGWFRYTKTAKVTGTTQNQPGVAISYSYLSGTRYFTRFKVEEGTVATDWSPSPQDTVDALDAMDGRLGDVETRVQVFYQTSKPTYTAVGDIWYDTDSNPLEIWKCTNVSTQAHSAFTDPVLTRALSAATAAQTTANGKINTFVGSSTPTALAAGDLWLDTANKNIWKRATAAGTGGWVQYLTAAGYLITTGITIDGTDLTVKATGNLNLAADGNLNVQNGGNLNVLNGGDIEISNGGDINVASGGKINLTGADGIYIGTSPFSVGGTNLLRNSGDFPNTDGWNIYSANGGKTLNAVLSGTYGRNVLRIGGIDENVLLYTGVLTHRFKVGDAYTISFNAEGNHPIEVMVSDGNQENIVINFGIITSTIKDTGTYYKYSATATVIGVQNNPVLRIRIYGVDGTVRYFDHIKLEKGTTATDWSPSPSDPASGVKTSKVTINNTGIDMTTGGTFTTTSQNFNIDAAGNVVMKGTVEASAGKIAGFSMSGGMLIDTATNGMNLELDPTNGVLDVGMMRITKYGTSDGFDLFYQGSKSGVCRVNSGSKSLNLTSEVGGTSRSISIGDGIFLFGNTYFKDSAFGYHEDSESYVPMLNSKNWLDYIYPVGAIYMSSSSTSPGTLFGGTWEALGGRFLLGADASHAAGTTGGSDEHDHGLAAGHAEIVISGSTNRLLSSYKQGNFVATRKIESTVGVISEEVDYATPLGGATDESGSMPPYLVVYMWKRTE